MSNMNQSDPPLCNYVAAFIDILGQQEQLKGCGLLPDSLDEIMPIVRKTVGVVNWLQTSFNSYFVAMTETMSADSEVPKEQQEATKELNKVELKFQRFSDGLLAFVSLYGEPRPEILNGLYCILGASGSICLTGLMQETPIRAGIDVGWGYELNKDELYGCVLLNAYSMERDIAQFPRVVLGEHVRAYLNLCIKVDGDDISRAYTRHIGSVCLELLGQDSHGVDFVDYLGPGFKKYIAYTLEPKDYNDAYEYINEQIRHWDQLSNAKLSQRYMSLKEYFDGNRGNWEH